MTSAPDIGPENVLGDYLGEDSASLMERLGLALRFVVNWYKATEDSEEKAIWWHKIDTVRGKLEAAYAAVKASAPFPGNTATNAYADAQLAFPSLYRELALSPEMLPRMQLIDYAAGYLDALIKLPGAVAPKVADALAEAIKKALMAIFGQLWPVAVILGLVLLLYAFVQVRRALK